MSSKNKEMNEVKKSIQHGQEIRQKEILKEYKSCK
jgi:hypothetical protein